MAFCPDVDRAPGIIEPRGAMPASFRPENEPIIKEFFAPRVKSVVIAPLHLHPGRLAVSDSSGGAVRRPADNFFPSRSRIWVVKAGPIRSTITASYPRVTPRSCCRRGTAACSERCVRGFRLAMPPHVDLEKKDRFR